MAFEWNEEKVLTLALRNGGTFSVNKYRWRDIGLRKICHRLFVNGWFARRYVPYGDRAAIYYALTEQGRIRAQALHDTWLAGHPKHAKK